MSTWLITGCSTGLGRHLAQAVLEHGHNAIVTARDAAKVQDLVDAHPDTGLALSLDVTNPAQVAAAARPAEERFAGRSLQQSSAAIADYADTAGRRRKEHDTAHGNQPGDPSRAAEAIITAVEAPEPPFLLLLGADARQGFQAVLDAERKELDRWE